MLLASLSVATVACSLLAPSDSLYLGDPRSGTGARGGSAGVGSAGGGGLGTSVGGAGGDVPGPAECPKGTVDAQWLEPECQPIPSDGLFMWITAEDVVLGGVADGAPVSNWPMRSVGADLTQFESDEQPVLHAPAGEPPTVRFEGCSFLNVPTVSRDEERKQAVTLAVVYRHGLDVAGEPVGCARESGNDADYGYWGTILELRQVEQANGLSIGRHGADEALFVGTKDAGAFSYRIAPSHYGAMASFVARLTSPSTLSTELCGELVEHDPGTTDTPLPDNAAFIGFLGKNAPASQVPGDPEPYRRYFQGDIATVLIYDRALAPAEQEMLDAHLLALSDSCGS